MSEEIVMLIESSSIPRDDKDGRPYRQAQQGEAAIFSDLKGRLPW